MGEQLSKETLEERGFTIVSEKDGYIKAHRNHKLILAYNGNENFIQLREDFDTRTVFYGKIGIQRTEIEELDWLLVAVK